MGNPYQPGPEGKERERLQKPVPEPGGESSVERPPDKTKDTASIQWYHRQEAGAGTNTPQVLSGAFHWPDPKRVWEHIGAEPTGLPPGHRAWGLGVGGECVKGSGRCPAHVVEMSAGTEIRQTVKSQVPSTSLPRFPLEGTTVTSFLSFQEESMYLQTFSHK